MGIFFSKYLIIPGVFINKSFRYSGCLDLSLS
uniref:Uncharacterized protein n=1 Tax=virus sp. ctDYl1 TaxID=2826795 RepID=A0A8S5R9U6_9VIRU|nr:MAG TPA: hypothetical protein [virus sp. ctDYl1]DAP49160.1 MAG TPA: hypothetical protein [Caudoviricetes sp.]DAT63209.1 MAG TPA: hypothetical protein [Caudoviricetes sp.]